MDWQQWFFDLMANNEIDFHVSGELNHLDATLIIDGRITHDVIECSDLGDVLIQLMKRCDGEVMFPRGY